MAIDQGRDERLCAFVQGRVNEFLDNELDEETADIVRRHLAECEECSDEATTWDLIRHLLKRAYHPWPAPARLLEAITANIRAAGAPQTAAVD
jgi:anti-sigma factor (TIGR02949 family)